jgi:predicted DNA binding protein
MRTITRTVANQMLGDNRVAKLIKDGVLIPIGRSPMRFESSKVYALEREKRKETKKPNITTNKLTEQQVLEIRAKYEPRKYTVNLLRDEYGVSRSAIADIIQGKTWTHI